MTTPRPPKVGIAYRLPLGPWLASRPSGVDCLELTAEHFYALDAGPLRRLAESYPLVVHTSRLSLGSPGPLDASELERFAAIVSAADPLWISEHLGFRRIGEIDLGLPQPVALTRDSLEHFVSRAREIMQRCGKRLLLENVASQLSIRGELAEPDFLNRWCERSGGGLLLDLTGLVVGSRAHRLDPQAWLREIDARRIVQLHVGHCATEDGRWVVRHAGRVDDAVCELAREVLAAAPDATVILERDASFPPPAELAAELQRLSTCAEAGSARRPSGPLAPGP